MVVHEAERVELYGTCSISVQKTENQTPEEKFFCVFRLQKELFIMAPPKKMNNSSGFRKYGKTG